MTTFAVINVGAGAYSIDGNSNPTLNLVRGNTYTFNVNAAGHPFWIKTAAVTGTGSAYNDGVTNNGVAVGTLSFTVPSSAPSTLYYICQIHSSMQGILSISGNTTYTETVTDSFTLSDSLSVDAGTQLTDNLSLSDTLSINYQQGTSSSVLSTGRIKDRVSELINSQLPEFIRTDNTTFVAFLKYYYKFLEQDQGALELVQNARQYSDIDKTTTSFVNYFLANYANDLPVNLQVNKSLLIKKIEGLYKAKGSSLSIETLFKVLYDTVATTSHPYDFVLRPSDGRWSFRTSIRVLLTSGSIVNLQDRFLNLVKNNIAYTVEIVRVKTLDTNLYEIFYKSLVDVPFEINDDVFVNTSAGTIFTGIVKPTTTAYQVSFGGTGFRVGEVFNLTIGGQDTLVRIAKVGANGSIQTLKFINFGYNYSSNFTITLSNALGVASSTKYFDTTAGGFQESVTVFKVHLASDPTRYFDSDYVTPFAYTGNTLASSSTTSQVITSATTGGTSNPSDAVLTFTIGAVARYPGEYIATQGFLSEPDVRLQDKNLYQPFAYQVESELDISVFYDLVKKLVHQAGTNLFVNRTLAATASVSANVEVVSAKNVFTQLNSVFSTLDSKVYNLQKPLANVTSISDNFISLDVYKPISDTVTITESLNLILYLAAFSDSVTMADVNGLVGGFNLDDVLESFGPITTHAPGDPLRYFDSNYVDPFTYTGSINNNLDELTFNNSSNLTSSSALTDAGSGIKLDYDTGTYFANIYAGSVVLSFN